MVTTIMVMVGIGSATKYSRHVVSLPSYIRCSLLYKNNQRYRTFFPDETINWENMSPTKETHIERTGHEARDPVLYLHDLSLRGLKHPLPLTLD